MDAESLRAEADALRDRRLWSRAADAYGRYLALMPQDRGLRVQRGHCLKESGEVEAALALYRQAEAEDPAEADIHVQVGHALKLLGRLAEAAEAYGRALLHDPRRADAAAECAALLPGLDVPAAGVLVLGGVPDGLPEAGFAVWDAAASGFRWLPRGLALHLAAGGAVTRPAAAPRLADGGVVLLAGPVPVAALAVVPALAPGAPVALLDGSGWSPRARAMAMLLADGQGADAAAAIAAARAAPGRALPAPRAGHAVPLGDAPAAVAGPETALGLLAPRSGAWGAVGADGRGFGPGVAWIRLGRAEPGALLMLVMVAARAACRITAGCGDAEADTALDPGEAAILRLPLSAGEGPLDLRLAADGPGARAVAVGVARADEAEQRLALHEALVFRRVA
jgi:tetratricopeptide (TPR) repeat protein